MSSTPPPASPTSVTPSSDEPGWFGDGEGNQRFWDGARWTSLVSSRRVFPGRASSTPEPKLISESPLPEDYAPGAAPLAPPVGSAVDASVEAPPVGAPLAPPTGAPVAPPAGYAMAPPTGAPATPPTGLPTAPPTGAPLDVPAPRTSSVAGSFAPPRPATSAASAPTPRAATTAPALRGRSTWPWAALAVAAVLVVAAAVIAGLPGLLIALGVVALIAGLIPLVRSGAAWIPGIRTRAAGGAAAGLALVLIAGGAVASTLPTPSDDVADPDTIEISDSRPVPNATDPANPLPISADGLVEMVDVTRMSGADAGDTLAAAGFGIAFAGSSGGGGAFVRQDVGIVASQDPAAGTRVAPGTVVTLTLATPAPDRIALPVVPKAPDVPSRPGTRPGTGTFNPGTGGGGGNGGGGTDPGTSNPGTGGGSPSQPDPTSPADPEPQPTTDPPTVPTPDPTTPTPVDPPVDPPVEPTVPPVDPPEPTTPPEPETPVEPVPETPPAEG
ncbi:hypothetical protein JOE38_000230 [Clavibacter michiganensis]|uniref:PASTA domain-containing protein n=1 Tax=Clavibacter michiganensis TaxID=28447 RepID=UPI00195BEE03|nr:PASTA domain-containing protein [Clavibacter michiganensis]MBM7410407.1 hypothetical protein [Clavibacter michiganensis]